MSAEAGSWDGEIRVHPAELGVWGFMASVGMLFAAFVSAYLVRRAGADWDPVALPGLLWLNSALLVASSISLEGARRRIPRHGVEAARAGLGGTIVLGAAFVLGQLTVWSQLVSAGVYQSSNPHAAFFYIFTGLHGLHLLVGLVVLSVVALRLTEGSPSAQRRRLTLAASYWHFMAVVWIGLFTVVSVL